MNQLFDIENPAGKDIVNPELLRRVRRLRARHPYEPMPMSVAVAIARYEMTTPPQIGKYPFLEDLRTHPWTVEGEVNGLHVQVSVVYDEDSRLGEDDITGTFTDVESETTIKNTQRNWNTDCKYYEPATIRRSETRADYRGMSKSVADDAMRATIEQDMRDDATRIYHGIRVTVSLDGHVLAETSLWGIDTIDGYDGCPYFVEIASELIDEALGMARKKAPRLVREARAHADRLAEVLGVKDEV